MVALQTHRRTEAQWVDLIDRIMALEDENKNQISNERIFKRQVGWLVIQVLLLPDVQKTCGR